MIYFALVFSFLLEIVFSNVTPINGLFIPLFLLTSLCLIYKYFDNKKSNFLFICIIAGLIYDITFADTLFLNTLSFLACGYLIKVGYNFINPNILSTNILNIFIIIIYRIISYFLFIILKDTSIDLLYLLRGIYSSLIINIIYGILFYIIISKIFKIIKDK